MRKPEQELTIRDLEPVVISGPVGKFREGDRVTAVDRFRRTVTGTITRFERMDTKASATGTITYRKTPAYYGVVKYAPHESIVLDVRKLSAAHPELPDGRA